MLKRINNGTHDTTCEVQYSIEHTQVNEWTITARVKYLNVSEDWTAKVKGSSFIDELRSMATIEQSDSLDEIMWDSIYDKVEMWATELYDTEQVRCNACNGQQMQSFEDDRGSDEYTGDQCEQCNGTGECSYNINNQNK